MHPFLHCLSLLVSLVVAPVPLQGGAQDEAKETTANLIRALRNPRLDSAEQQRAVRVLLERGANGARSLFIESRLRFRVVHRDYAQRRKRFLRAFAKAGAPVLRGRWPKGASGEIDSMRARVLTLSRSRTLTKGAVHEQIDPLITKLEKLLRIDAAAVLAAKPALAATRGKIAALHEVLTELADRCARAADVIRGDAPGGAWLKTRPLPKAPATLDPELARLATEATPMRRKDRELIAANRDLAPQLKDPEEYLGIVRLNEIRVLLGLRALRIDVKLCNAARDHSADMQRLGFFSHTSPVPGKKTPGQRAALAGTTGGAENIAGGARSGADAIRRWWYSPGHHRNMMGNHMRVGLGRAGRLWTQMFGR